MKHPSRFQRVFRILASLLQQCCSTEVIQTLHDVWPSPGLLHCIHIFGGSCPLVEFCQVHISLCVQVLRSPILAALLHGTPAAGLSQTLRHGTRNGITELSQRAPPIFSWATISLGIGPNSSLGFDIRFAQHLLTVILILKDCVCSVTSIHAVQNLRTNSRLALRKRPFTTLPCFWQLVHKTKLLLPPLLQTLQGFLLCPAVLVQPKITFISLFSLSASKLSATGRRHSENQPET